MEVFRISKQEYAEIDGMGGLYYPGRWHDAGVRVVYTAESRSLAALEILTHLSKTILLASDFTITTIKIPKQVAIKTIEENDLPNDWFTMQNIYKTQKIGMAYLKESKYAILKVPSAIIDNEFNYILNPNHLEFQKFRVLETKNFSFDKRLIK